MIELNGDYAIIPIDELDKILSLAELGLKFKKQQNKDRTNRSSGFYDEIYKLVDAGYQPHEIIGRKIQVKDKKREITHSTYYRALERRKEKDYEYRT